MTEKENRMSRIKFEWVKTYEPIRISQYANDLGFNLRTLDYQGISAEIWDIIDGKIRNSIMEILDERWEDAEGVTKPLSQVKKGVYVITLGDNLSIDYNGKSSKVIYIGRGRIRSRIYNHFKLWVRYLSDSLQDISLDVWMAEIKIQGSANAFREVETDLLTTFREKYGVYPLQNYKSGDNHSKDHEYNCDWKAPINNPTNIQYGWAIRPLKLNPWAMECEDA